MEVQIDDTAKNLFTRADLEWITRERRPFIEQMDKNTQKQFIQAVHSVAQRDWASSLGKFSTLCEKCSAEVGFVYGYILSALAGGTVPPESLKERVAGIENTASYYYLAGMRSERECEYVQAIEQYSAALERDNDFVPAKFRLAYLMDLRGSEEDAISLYEQCVKKGDTDSNILLNLGCLYEDMSNYEKAIECYQKILEKGPNERAAMFLKDAQASLEMYVDDDKERENSKMAQVLSTPISDFELSVRSRNCLNKMKIKTLGDLIEKSEAELLSYKNFGETSLKEIKEILAKKGLKLGMGIEEKNMTKKTKEKKEKKPASTPPNQNLQALISNLELSVRSRKCLTSLNIQTIGELIQKKESELLECKNFGTTSLQEIKRKLAEIGLSLIAG